MYEILLLSNEPVIDVLLQNNEMLHLVDVPDSHVLCDVVEVAVEDKYISFWKLYKLTFDNLTSLIGQRYSSVVLGSRVNDGEAWDGFYTDSLANYELEGFWAVYRQAGLEFPSKDEEEERFGRTILFRRDRFRRGRPEGCRRGYLSVGAL